MDDALRLDERRRGMVEFLGRFKFDQVFGQARCVHVASERGKVTELHCEVTFDVCVLHGSEVVKFLSRKEAPCFPASLDAHKSNHYSGDTRDISLPIRPCAFEAQR